MTVLILFAVFLSGGVLVCALTNRKIETVLPVSFLAVMALMYIGGVFGLLKPMFYGVLALCGLCWIAAAVIGWRRGFRRFLGRVLTPGLFIYAVLFAIVWFMNRNALLWAVDDFTCWGDVVMGMCESHALSFHPDTRAMFASYPPALPVLQYFAQQVHQMVSGAGFSEALLYMTFQWALIAMYMPFLNGLSFRRPTSVLIWCAASFFMPMMVLRYSAYAIVYVDSLMAAAGGFVCVYPFVKKEMDGFDTFYLCLTLFALALMKDVALLFAAGGLICWAFQIGIAKSQELSARESALYTMRQMIPGILSVAAAKISWSVCLRVWNASNIQQSFSNPVTVSEILALFRGTSENMWRKEILSNFYHQMFNPIFRIFSTDGYVSYAALLIVGALALFLILRVWSEREEALRKRATALVGTVTGVIAAYTIGLCVLYMFKYTRAEAEILSAWNRYMDIIATYLFYCFAACFTYAAGKKMLTSRQLAIAAAGLMLFAPFSLAMDFVTGSYIEGISAPQKQYIAMADSAKEALVKDGAQEGAEIYLFCESEPQPYLYVRSRMRPVEVSYDPWYRISFTLNDGEIPPMSAEELEAITADYIVLCQLDEGFAARFAHCFENPEEIGLGFTYRRDPDTGKLRRI